MARRRGQVTETSACASAGQGEHYNERRVDDRFQDITSTHKGHVEHGISLSQKSSYTCVGILLDR